MSVIELEVRHAPSRPVRLGTRRRALRRAKCVAGGSARAQRAASLDTKKQLETSARNWLAEQYTEQDEYRRKLHVHKRLTNTVYQIWQSYARMNADEEGAAWMRGYEVQCREREGETPGQRAKRIREWRADNKPRGVTARAIRWEKQWFQLHNCQMEWVGYYADCCKGYTGPVAVPIGCNHRLCPLCAWHRSTRAQKRVRTMFDRLTHPALVTLTIPNLKAIRKHDFHLFRNRVRQFIAQHGGWIRGGVYSLECTFNRRDRTWHIHVHILADLSHPLPAKKIRDAESGKEVRNLVTIGEHRWLKFTALKRRLEFDWMRLWRSDWGKRARKNASEQRRNGDDYDFEKWITLTRLMRTRTHNGRFRTDISAQQLQMCFDWNARNRMVVDVRPVIDRDGAAREVLKYITKGANFADLPEAVEPFCDAVKGARLIQTFGSWYGVKLDEKIDAENPRDYLGECSCGMKAWKRLGVLHRGDVYLESDGRWRVRRPYDWKSSGTVPRPTIRALDVREGSLSHGNDTGIELESR